ncbi:MAG: TIGR03936 family radical SAM-associated protein, partial [Cyanobacteria bacterium P01_H01_bin.15]
FEPPQIPEFAGHFKPNKTRAQRFRVWFGKLGEMALVSHLDLMRLFDRVTRRAQLPIAFTGGFHPGPRISPASALSLGITSSGEIVDFELTERVELTDFETRLRNALPAGMPVYKVEEISPKVLSATRSLAQAEYHIDLESEETVVSEAWSKWLNQLTETVEIPWEKTTKSGKKVQVNLRDRINNPEILDANGPTAKIRVFGNCSNDGNQFHPEQFVIMLEQVTGKTVDLVHAHRQRLILKAEIA